MRRLELCANGPLRRQFQLCLNGRPLTWPADPAQPIGLRYRQSALYPCLHPCLPLDLPLSLQLLDGGGGRGSGRRAGRVRVAAWQLEAGHACFQPQPDPAPVSSAARRWPPLQGGICTLDMRLSHHPEDGMVSLNGC
jgi:hypothetical protein